jgi:hypothetical protein
MKLAGRRRLTWFCSARSIAIFAVIPAACAVGIWLSWVNDNAILRENAVAVTAGLSSDSTKISAINHWVYLNQGFTKNERFFLVPALGPTPNQVLESGGDCGDKSRLVSAMLWQLRINSGLAQIFPCRDCGPIHVVVEAEYEAGRMVVDTSTGSYRSLRAAIAGQRHARGRGESRKAVAFGLGLLEYDPAHLLRPHFLEDPKLALALVLFISAGMLLITYFMLYFVFARAARKFRLSFPRQPPGGVALGLHDKRG